MLHMATVGVKELTEKERSSICLSRINANTTRHIDIAIVFVRPFVRPSHAGIV